MSNYLIHHGILGQKWGVRRFQNEDGSLTSAGKNRYHIGSDDTKKRAKGIKRELNDYEQATARNRQQYADEKAKNDRYKAKADRLKERSRRTDNDKKRARLDTKRQELITSKLKPSDAKMAMYKKRIDKGQVYINKLVKKAESDGYSVISKDKYYNTTNVDKGRAFINAVGPVIMAAELMTMGFGASASVYTIQKGKKHNVKYVGDTNA